MAEVIMTIKAPKGTINLYELKESNWYGRLLNIELQCMAIKAFMEQHNA